MMRKAVGIAIIAASITFALLWLQHRAAVTLPAPSGPFAVGRMDFDWRDPARVDPLAPSPGVQRELTVWVWYPAARNTGTGEAEYLPAPLRAALLQHMGAPLRLLTHDLARVHVHAIQNAAVARERPTFPVVLVKPGIGALALDYTTLTEDLASHGYVVAASDSPYSTAAVVYRDGRVVSRTAAGHPVDEGHAPSMQALEKLLRVWVADNRFVLDRLNTTPPFAGRLNMNAVGAFGHSFGGAAALEFCQHDARCKAAIDVDGIPFGDVAHGAPIEKPMLFILSDHRGEAEAPQVQAQMDAIRRRLPNRDSDLVLAGSRHFNMSDMALTKNTPVAKIVGMLGPIDPRAALATTSRWIADFFGRYLNGAPASRWQQ